MADRMVLPVIDVLLVSLAAWAVAMTLPLIQPCAVKTSP
jgi:hypothetical protein